MSKILITGITGFLGAHIAEHLISNNISVIGLKRQNSDIWRCEQFKERIEWIDIDPEKAYKDKVVELSPDIIIHCAWIGVHSRDRDNLVKQAENIQFLIDLLETAKKIELKKFIFLGSQAEYGNINGKISEELTPIATNAYGSIKLACLEILKTFCMANNINWLWLRVFSLFGEKESDSWLIPSIIKNMNTTDSMDFTLGEQNYAYLYVHDFAKILNRITLMDISSGIYNISSNDLRSIRSLIEIIKENVNPSFKLNFGALEYRKDQSMHIEGDMSKLISQIGEIHFTDFKLALQQTIKYFNTNKII